MSIQKAFGIALKEMRTKSGLSQEALALKADLDRTFISLLERGMRQPTLTNFEPTYCGDCGSVIVLSEGGFSTRGDKYHCEECTDKQMRKLMTKPMKRALPKDLRPA